MYPVGSQLPTEHELCERFAVSRYTVREALRRLRDDNLVSSRPRAGTLVVPRPNTNSYAQDVMSINDLLAFAAGAQFAIESNAMVADRRRARRAHRAAGGRRNGWRCADIRRGDEDSTPRSAGPSTTSTARSPRSAGCCSATPGPIFPLIEDLFGVSIVEVHQEISAVLITAGAGRRAQVDVGHRRAARCSARYTTSDGEVAQVTVNTHPSSRFRHSMTMRRVKGRRAVATTAAPSRRQRAVGRDTLADALRDAARGDARPNRCWSTATFGSTARPCTSRRPHWRTRCWRGCPRQRGVVHAAQLARGRRHLPRRDAGRHGGEPDPAVAARPRAARSSSPTPTAG